MTPYRAPAETTLEQILVVDDIHVWAHLHQLQREGWRVVRRQGPGWILQRAAETRPH